MNTEKLKGYWEKVKGALGNLSKKVKILIVAVLAALVVFAVGLAVFFNTRPYATLIDGASAEETATVLTWLEGQGVTDFRMEGSGTILVPQAQATSLKAKLLQEQYSSSNAPYSGYFERVSALSTVQDRNVAKLSALVEEIEKTIRKFDGVRDVSVNIELGEDRGYVLDTNNVVNASAGVILTMDGDKLLSTGQANAIRNYISHSVAALDVDDVSIQDTRGNIYDGMDLEGGNTAADATALALQTEQWWANQIRSQIEQQLFKMYGEENVGVTVRCNVELGEKTVNDYEVRLPDFAEDGSTEGAGIIGTKFYSWQLRADDDTVAGGLVGTPSNSELPTYVENGETIQGLLGRLGAEGSIEYDNSKTQTQMIITAATLKDVTVSVSINSTASGPIDLEAMTRHVAVSGGIQAPLELPDGVTEADYLARKVSVLSTPFYQAPEQPTPPSGWEALGIPVWVPIAAGVGLLVFAIILTVILMLRRRKRKKQQEEERAVEELLATAMPGQSVELGPDGQPLEPGVEIELDEEGNPVSGADVMDLHTERSMELRQNIRDYVDENMEVAALLIKSWLKEDGDNG